MIRVDFVYRLLVLEMKVKIFSGCENIRVIDKIYGFFVLFIDFIFEFCE